MSAFIAKASATFDGTYQCTPTSTHAWGYDTTIPAGTTGVIAVLHAGDRVGCTEIVHHENCTTIKTTGYTYLPHKDSSSLSYCIIRDLAPCGCTNWRSSCVGE